MGALLQNETLVLFVALLQCQVKGENDTGVVCEGAKGEDRSSSHAFLV